ncbi:MAG: PIN domain-containing protein [Candidatus Scalindua sp.]|jgi:predicted nucleic acid-binding protein|nr:PIN domain-containing protein [Candidatus Scalindua sp.]MBT6045455.1 PIN domain-containing protein [Candidatus Scalindua sp.]MBT6230779.1 PIN domain-containing protein [Candidatus Scalindua sp.]MBT6561021.1 PIN domain-containing protein [Candidatus Scalindua sp.]MBT7211470.1 PIN domain-containing protein [Candidatus Scalindua sp.]
MNDKYFIDSNIIVYAHDIANQHKQEVAKRLIFEGLKSETGVISTQVLSEFFVTVTKKIEKPLPIDIAQREIQLLGNLTVIEIEYEMVLQAIETHRQNNISYWDSMIIAAAQRSQCSKLYSEDLSDGQTINNVQIINPFRKTAL